MPELPEVETIGRDLESEIVGLKFTEVKFIWPGSLKGVSADEFRRLALGQEIIRVERRAKNLAIRLNNHYSLLMHMKMTGHLLLEPGSKTVNNTGEWVDSDGVLRDPLNQYIRVIFWLNNGKIMAFSDLRKFGYIKLTSDAELKNVWEEYGPEPFSNDYNTDYLMRVFGSKRQAIKKVIMDQTVIAGIGNIYADEILWETRIHPLTPANQIDRNNIDAIVAATRKILTKAIELRGTSSSDYRDTKGEKGKFEAELNVYRRTGLPCPRCGTPIERISVGGRGTHFCPREQVLEVR